MSGEGLDREAVRRTVGRAMTGTDWNLDWRRLYAADVPALLDALEAAEAEVARLRALLTGECRVHHSDSSTPCAVAEFEAGVILRTEALLRTEGGAL